jgi:dipeptidyl aminopeptidase/acylaminoacyl peptidase
LLLIHGAIDDNVHPQNTLQFAHELQKAGKPFRMMLYPKSRHGVVDAHQVRHLRGLMLDFIGETLLGRKPAA